MDKPSVRIIAFHGADHKVGVTQITGCVAEYIAEKYQKDCLLINADGEYGFDYYKPERSLDDLETIIRSENIDALYIKSVTYLKTNLYFLNLSNMLLQNRISTDLVEKLLNKLSEEFDYILLDTGSCLYDSISIGALFCADYIFYVLNQRESSLRKIEFLSSLYSRLKINFDKYILNEFSKAKTIDKEYIFERLCIDPEDTFLIRESRKGGLAELENKLLIDLRHNRSFAKDIALIAKEIVNDARVQN